MITPEQIAAEEATPQHWYKVMHEHFAWLHQYAYCDDDFQRRNFLDNMQRVRSQVEDMKVDLDRLMQTANLSK
jgi:hypothetical protein